MSHRHREGFQRRHLHILTQAKAGGSTTVSSFNFLLSPDSAIAWRGMAYDRNWGVLAEREQKKKMSGADTKNGKEIAEVVRWRNILGPRYHDFSRSTRPLR